MEDFCEAKMDGAAGLGLPGSAVMADPPEPGPRAKSAVVADLPY